MWVVDVRGLEAAPHLIVRTHRDGRLLRAHDLRQPNRSEPLLFQPLFLSLTLSLYAPRWKILGTGSPSLLDRVRSFAKTKTTASRWGKKRRKSRLQWCYFFSVSIRTVFLMDVQAVSALSELRPPSTPTLTPAITTAAVSARWTLPPTRRETASRLGENTAQNPNVSARNWPRSADQRRRVAAHSDPTAN